MPNHADYTDAANLHAAVVFSETEPLITRPGLGWVIDSTAELFIRNADDDGWHGPFGAVDADALTYIGTWNASTNSPALADGGGNPDEAVGNMYRVSTGGTQNLGSGAITFAAGDYVILNSSKVWEKIDTTDLVTSVAGQTGAVTLSVSDVSGAAPLASPTFTGTPTVPDDAYDATTWNTNLGIPTKNALRDKIEAILAAAANVTVRKNSGADVGTRARLNFIEGTNVTFTIADDAGDGEIDITINATGGGGGSAGGLDVPFHFGMI
jgi:hypothetical protein